jgi:hypothetical protein
VAKWCSSEPWPPYLTHAYSSPCTPSHVSSGVFLGLTLMILFYEGGVVSLTPQPPPPPPSTWRTRVFVFVDVTTFDLSGMGGGALPVATLPPANLSGSCEHTGSYYGYIREDVRKQMTIFLTFTQI